MANRLRALLHKDVHLCHGQGHHRGQPIAPGSSHLPPRSRRSGALAEDEIRPCGRTWTSRNSIMSPEIKRSLKLILVTGQRPGEVAGCTGGRSKTLAWLFRPKRSKNGKSHRVYLTETAWRSSVTGKDTSSLPSRETRSGNRRGSPSLRLAAQHQGARLRRKGTKRTYKPKPEDPNRMGLARLHPSRPRRTAATRMAELG